MSWWSGIHTRSPRDRFVSWNSYSKIVEMQNELLKAGGKKALYWQRRKSGEVCPCARNGMPQSPHSICYGTGIVGGFRLYNSREIYLYRVDNNIKVWSDEKGIVETYPIVANMIETDWYDGNTFDFVGKIESVVYKGGTRVEFSSDGINWFDTNNFNLPVDQFKIKLSNIDTLFEVCRIRIKEKNDNWMYFAENPPLRMEQLFRWGIDMQPFDVRVWTISDNVIIRTGDVIKWLEGYYAGERYTVVNARVTQFVREKDNNTPDLDSSNVLTQILGMRKVKSAEELFRIW